MVRLLLSASLSTIGLRGSEHWHEAFLQYIIFMPKIYNVSSLEPGSPMSSIHPVHLVHPVQPVHPEHIVHPIYLVHPVQIKLLLQFSSSPSSALTFVIK